MDAVSVKRSIAERIIRVKDANYAVTKRKFKKNFRLAELEP